MSTIEACENLVDELAKMRDDWGEKNEWIGKGIDIARDKLICLVSEQKFRLIKDFVIKNPKIFATPEEIEELKHYFTGGLTHCKGVENGEKKENS